MEHSVLDPSWDDDGIDIFELNDAQHSVAGSDSSALDVQERIDVTQQVFMQVFQDEVGKMRCLISSISQEWKKELQDLQEQVTQKIDVRFGERWSQVQEELAVYLAGREATLGQRFRDLGDSLSARLDLFHTLIPQGPPATQPEAGMFNPFFSLCTFQWNI